MFTVHLRIDPDPIREGKDTWVTVNDLIEKKREDEGAQKNASIELD